MSRKVRGRESDGGRVVVLEDGDGEMWHSSIIWIALDLVLVVKEEDEGAITTY